MALFGPRAALATRVAPNIDDIILASQTIALIDNSEDCVANGAKVPKLLWANALLCVVRSEWFVAGVVQGDRICGVAQIGSLLTLRFANSTTYINGFARAVTLEPVQGRPQIALGI
jgi:hypothetical protein